MTEEEACKTKSFCLEKTSDETDTAEVSVKVYLGTDFAVSNIGSIEEQYTTYLCGKLKEELTIHEATAR